MSFFRRIFGWLGRFFRRASEVVSRNALIVKASLGAGIGLFLENNEKYADEVVEALRGLREAVSEGRISSNSVLLEELSGMLKRCGLKPATSAALMAVFMAAVSTMEKFLPDGSDEFGPVWDGIIDYAITVAESYVQE